MDFWIPIALSVLLEAVKSPSKRVALKRQFAKVVRTVVTYYGDDAEFRELAGLTEAD